MSSPPKKSGVALVLKDLRTRIAIREGEVRGVDGVSLEIRRGEVFGLAGESGSGKSMTAFSIMRLLPVRGRIAGGEVLFQGEDLAKVSDERMRDLRGDRIAMIFQDPMTSLNPVFTIGDQISEPLRKHRGLSASAARARTIELLTSVGIANPKQRFNSYPHEFSGGMRQRVMIAMALACKPDLLIADEPTTALDVTIEKQILALIEELRANIGAAILLITHNLALLAEHCDRIAVMYAGQIVEMADTDEILSNPLHPYTKALLGSMPRAHISKGRLKPIVGLPPTIIGDRKGCAFAPRCTAKMPQCETIEPEMREVAPGHDVRCLLFETGHE
jgi:oligopeptide/dipeptide ABC transporter ATP-binding protein